MVQLIFQKIQNLMHIIIAGIKHLISRVTASSQLRALAEKVDPPFFVIVMPGGLHILMVFLRYIVNWVPLILVLNGIDEYEKAWIDQHYPELTKLSLRVTFKHGSIIDLIVDNFKKPFGMIDSDCFIFNSNYFEDIKSPPEDAVVNAFFYVKNQELGLEIPQTYILYFNPSVINKIKKKYHVTSNIYTYEKLKQKDQKGAFYVGY